MKKLTDAFSSIFSDNEWFNKVLVGGFFFLLIPFGIGIVMLNGFLLECITRIHLAEKGMPYWRNYKQIFRHGIKQSWFSLTFIAAAYLILFYSSIQITLPASILILALVLTANTVSITKTFDLVSLLISCILLLIAISIGWMWIVVGWPLLIFLAMLVQTQLFVQHRRTA